MDALTTEIRDWLEQGANVRVDGVRLFYRVAGQQPAGLPWMVCFHGFPTSSWDWHRLLPQLAGTHRVLVFGRYIHHAHDRVAVGVQFEHLGADAQAHAETGADTGVDRHLHLTPYLPRRTRGRGA